MKVGASLLIQKVFPIALRVKLIWVEGEATVSHGLTIKFIAGTVEPLASI